LGRGRRRGGGGQVAAQPARAEPRVGPPARSW
jgi:hypothetical protein